MITKPIHHSLRSAIRLVSVGLLSGTAFAGMATENFDDLATATDHGWTGSGNETSPQSFGFSATSNVLGTAGEAGGTFSRATGLTYYADTSLGGSFKRSDSFSFSGSARLSNTDFDGTIFIGFFNASNLNQTTTSFIGCFIGEPAAAPPTTDPFRVSAQIRQGATTTGSSLITADQNTTFTFNLSWVGAPDGSGTLSGTINGTAVNIVQGAAIGSFNAFGIGAGFAGNAQTKTATAYLDSVTYSTVDPAPPVAPFVTETFESDASATANGWVGSENDIGGSDFGWSNSGNVLGTPGEAGGIFSRSGYPRYYADKTLDGVLDRTRTFSMSGSMNLANVNFDGNMFVGFFDSAPATLQTPSFIGFWIGEPSGDPGNPFRLYAQVKQTGGAGSSSAAISVQQNTTVTYHLTWTGLPNGAGTLTGDINGYGVSLSATAAIGMFDAFGIGAGFAGNDDELLVSGGSFFDNLTYTTYSTPPVKPESTETFDSAASAAANGWASLGGTVDGNNFGWSDTSDVAGTAGEAGGVFARTQNIHYYADTDIGGSFKRSDTFSFKGSGYLTNVNFDGNFFVGFFDQNDLDTSGEDNASFVGMWFGEPKPASDTVNPFRGLGSVVSPTGAPVHKALNGGTVPQLTPFNFDLTWVGNPDGSGTLAGTINGNNVNISHGMAPGVFNAFGIGTGFSNSDIGTLQTGACYFDNLTYSIIPPDVSDFVISAYSYNAGAGSSTLTFTSTPGTPYQIQQSTTLSGWTKIIDVNGTAAATETTVMIPESLYSGPAPKSFFRVAKP